MQKYQTESKMPRVLLADAHKIVAEGLATLLRPEFDLAGIVEDGRQLVAEAAKFRPDLIVTEISLPLLNGIEAARQLRTIGVKAKIVFLTTLKDVTSVAQALDAGAKGYVLKHCAASELALALHRVLEGKVYVSPKVSHKDADWLMGRIDGRRKAVNHLTPRQREVVQLLAEGHSAKQVGAVLYISARTAEFHKYQAMHELRLRNTAQLIQYAIRHGIASP